MTWVFNSVFSAAALVLSPEWNDWPWVSRVGALLLIPILWLFAVVACCSADATFRRICLGGGTFFLGGGMLLLQVEGPTWKSFGDQALTSIAGVGLLVAAAAGRAFQFTNPALTSAKDRHG